MGMVEIQSRLVPCRASKSKCYVLTFKTRNFIFFTIDLNLYSAKLSTGFGIPRCKKKIILDINIISHGIEETKDFIFLEINHVHVMEEHVRRKLFLYRPLVLRLNVHPPKISYPLRFEGSVNYETAIRALLLERKPKDVRGWKEDAGHECKKIITSSIHESSPSLIGGFRCERRERQKREAPSKKKKESKKGKDYKLVCVTTDPIWYNTFALRRPRLRQTLSVSVIRRQLTEWNDPREKSGTRPKERARSSPRRKWVDIERKSLTVTSQKTNDDDAARGIWLRYEDFVHDRFEWPLREDDVFLFIPQPGVNSESSRSIAKPEHFLIVSKDQVDLGGNDCNRIGYLPSSLLRNSSRCNISFVGCDFLQLKTLYDDSLMLVSPTHSQPDGPVVSLEIVDDYHHQASAPVNGLLQRVGVVPRHKGENEDENDHAPSLRVGIKNGPKRESERDGAKSGGKRKTTGAPGVGGADKDHHPSPARHSNFLGKFASPSGTGPVVRSREDGAVYLELDFDRKWKLSAKVEIVADEERFVSDSPTGEISDVVIRSVGGRVTLTLTVRNLGLIASPFVVAVPKCSQGIYAEEAVAIYLSPKKSQRFSMILSRSVGKGKKKGQARKKDVDTRARTNERKRSDITKEKTKKREEKRSEMKKGATCRISLQDKSTVTERRVKFNEDDVCACIGHCSCACLSGIYEKKQSVVECEEREVVRETMEGDSDETDEDTSDGNSLENQMLLRIHGQLERELAKKADRAGGGSGVGSGGGSGKAKAENEEETDLRRIHKEYGHDFHHHAAAAEGTVLDHLADGLGDLADNVGLTHLADRTGLTDLADKVVVGPVADDDGEVETNSNPRRLDVKILGHEPHDSIDQHEELHPANLHGHQLHPDNLQDDANASPESANHLGRFHDTDDHPAHPHHHHHEKGLEQQRRHHDWGDPVVVEGHDAASHHVIYAGHHAYVNLLILLLILLLLAGLAKALVGLLVFPTVASFGLDLFSQKRKQKAYFEKKLRPYEVIYDWQDYPVDPHTRDKTLPMDTEKAFLLNLLFGFYLFLIPLHWCCLKKCCGLPEKAEEMPLDFPTMELSPFPPQETRVKVADTDDNRRCSILQPDWRKEYKTYTDGRSPSNRLSGPPPLTSSPIYPQPFDPYGATAEEVWPLEPTVRGMWPPKKTSIKNDDDEQNFNQFQRKKRRSSRVKICEEEYDDRSKTEGNRKKKNCDCFLADCDCSSKTETCTGRMIKCEKANLTNRMMYLNVREIGFRDDGLTQVKEFSLFGSVNLVDDQLRFDLGDFDLQLFDERLRPLRPPRYFEEKSILVPSADNLTSYPLYPCVNKE